MLILSRYLKAVIFATYLCSLSHLVENRHMSNSEDQNLEPQLDSRLLSLVSVAARHQSVHRPPNNTSQQSSTHHKRRHKHNLIYNTNVDINSDLLINNYKSDKDNIFKTHLNNNNFNNKDKSVLTKSPRSSDDEHIQNSRQFLLLNQCSRLYISVFDRKITARAKKGDQFTEMSLETVGGNGIHIRADTGLYICFNKIGKLVTRYIPNMSCRFTEEVTHSGRFKYRSVYNPDWYLGFNKKGGPITGKILSQSEPTQQQKKSEKCFQFLKKVPQKPIL